MPGPVVVSGALLMCSFGMAPSSYTAIGLVSAGGMPVGTIKDSIPMLNIKPFGMCMSPSNPTVAAATAAALGVLTPMACIPVTGTPWTPGAPLTSATGLPLITSSSTCNCAWGGVITVSFPGQVQVTAS
jgi:hypothetical protein